VTTRCWAPLSTTRSASPSTKALACSGSIQVLFPSFYLLMRSSSAGEVVGGAAIEKLAQAGDPSRFLARLPVPMLKHNNCDFSYAGEPSSSSLSLCLTCEGFKNAFRLLVAEVRRNCGLVDDFNNAPSASRQPVLPEEIVVSSSPLPHCSDSSSLRHCRRERPATFAPPSRPPHLPTSTTASVAPSASSTTLARPSAPW
jgi:hypothetical protein